ncbi:MAG TPA: acyl-CoA thioesterase [Spirochaetia bacterium]|nr:acyl-CoA thioesterase [Spirochaetia bacterium]
MKEYSFRLDMAVRDYECDMQAIVNNSVYQNYLEHARHEFLKSIGVSFKDYTARGVNLVVIRAEIDYRFPLSSGDRFWVGVNLVRESRLRIAFLQDIYREPDNRLIVEAKVTGTALNSRNRPELPDSLAEILEKLQESPRNEVVSGTVAGESPADRDVES